MASSNNPFGGPSTSDDFDMNDYIHLDQSYHTSPSPTNVKLEPRQSLDPRQLMLQPPKPTQQQYHGPSHNYDQFRQQTGLPPGAISHVHAVNQFSNSNHLTGAFPGYNSGFDFSGLDGQDHHDSQDSHGFFAPGDGHGDEFTVDPSAVAPDSRPAAAFRAWPGMHSQQAKQHAQAQVDAKQQRNEDAMNSQQQLPSNFEQTYATQSRSETASEPQVNEQISRLLNQMRHNSAASVDDDDESRHGLGGMQSLSHTRKIDEDMDEDERLLASEEGKKLSSKERRQLRNKVSARAFRSRRKEYITQLEGEVATKTNECNDLKMTNRHLLEQNRQLTQLCKTMLNHRAFGTFMDEMSSDPSLLNAFAPSQQSSSQSTASQTSQTPEQPQQPAQSSHQPQQQNVTHVGMSMVPETNLDFSMLNLGGNHWGSSNNFQQPQIFAIHELPAGPSFEELQSSVLSGKSGDDAEELAIAKTDVPILSKELSILSKVPQPASEVGSKVDDPDVTNDPVFALYTNSPPTSSGSSSKLTMGEALSQLERSLSEKSPSVFNLQVRRPRNDEEALYAVDRLFARAESSIRRIELTTRRLDM